MFPTPALHHSTHSSTSSISTIVLDLPFPRLPKHARFPCPYMSPDEFASEHETYTSEEYDRTSIDPPTAEERACALPGRGERCLDAELDEDEACDDVEDGELVFEDDDAEEDQDGSDLDDGQDTPMTTEEGDLVSSSRSFCRASRLDAGEESDREASPPPFPISSSRKRARARPTSTPLPSRKASMSNSAQESSPPSPTTQRRILWLQSQSENLPAALKSRLLMLSTFGDTPPASPAFEDGIGSEESSMFGSGFGSSPSEKCAVGGGFPFSFAGLAAMRERMGAAEDDEEEELEVRRDVSERNPTFAESEPSSFTSSRTIDTSCLVVPSLSEEDAILSTSPSPTITPFFSHYHPSYHAPLSRETSTFSTISTSSTCTASSIASEDGFQSPSCSSEVSTCYSSDQPHSHREDDDSESEHLHHPHEFDLHRRLSISAVTMGLGFGPGAGGKGLRRFDTKGVDDDDEEADEAEEARGRSGFGLSRGFRTFEL